MFESQVRAANDRESRVDAELQEAKDDLAGVKAENERVKLSLVDKRGQVEALEKMLSNEKERRDVESSELRNLLTQERDKSLQAAREAERFATEIGGAKREAERARADLEKKLDRIEELERELQQARLTAAQYGAKPDGFGLAGKLETKIEQLEAKHRDELTSVQVRLASKESEMHRMEALLLQLHQQLDQARIEKDSYRVDLDMAVISRVQADEALKYTRTHYDELKERSLETEEQL